jgi:hypothetical protein
MSFEDELRAAAKRYAEGWSAVQQRRRSWTRAVDDLVLPVLQQACRVLSREGLNASARARNDGVNASDVELSLPPFETGLSWRDREGKEQKGVERPAAMGYGQGDDGRVAHWRIGHSLEGDKPAEPRVIDVYADPVELTREVVEKHVLEFLREALSTSIRGEPTPTDRPIGFVVPTE